MPEANGGVENFAEVSYGILWKLGISSVQGAFRFSMDYILFLIVEGVSSRYRICCFMKANNLCILGPMMGLGASNVLASSAWSMGLETMVLLDVRVDILRWIFRKLME